MGQKTQRHWFIQEEVKWRSIAAAVWTCTATLPILTLYTCITTLDLSRHIYSFSDFFALVFSFKFFIVGIICSTVTGSLVILYTQRIKGTLKCPLNKVQMIMYVFKPSNLAFILASTAFFIVISDLVSSLRYASKTISTENHNREETEWLRKMEHLTSMTRLFGCTVGLLHSLDKILSQKIKVQFPRVQEAKFLFLKCKFPYVMSYCATMSAWYLYYFVIIYYTIKFALMVVIDSSEFTLFRYFLSFQLRWMFDSIPLLFHLWLTGTFILLLYNMSWQIFNVYQSQAYSFPLAHVVFAASDNKLLIQNLDESKPSIVRNHAFYELSLIVKQNFMKRQQIFSLNRGTEMGQPVICNLIMQNCLNCIEKLAADIFAYQSSLLNSPDSASGPGKTSDRNVCDVYSPVQVNAGVTNVATPRLWAKYGKHQSNDADQTVQPKANSQKDTQPWYISYFSFLIPNPSPTAKQAPVQTLRNIYLDHMIVKWSLQTISYLSEKSIVEDEYGVFQSHLQQALAKIIELKRALESVDKNTYLGTSLAKMHQSLCLEVKSSLYRITSTYGEDLFTIELDSEQRCLIEDFHQYEE